MMMYGFGDAQTPRPDSVDIMEEMTLQFVTDLVYFLIVISYSAVPSGLESVFEQRARNHR